MDSYISFATNLAYDAGEIIRNNFTIGMKKEFKKGDNSPVTASDIAINQMVNKAIKENYPDHSILSEEGGNENNSEYIWLCDPIDGTIPFSSGVPISTFSLALTKNGSPILGVVYDPFLDRLFFAEKGKGAYLNNKKIVVSEEKTIHSQIVYIGWWKHSVYNLEFVQRELSKRDVKFMNFCSYSYAGALLAAGEFGCLVFGDKYAWDVAAIKIIIEEAGGVCTDFTGSDVVCNKDINGFVASNKNIHNELLELVQKFSTKNN